MQDDDDQSQYSAYSIVETSHSSPLNITASSQLESSALPDHSSSDRRRSRRGKRRSSQKKGAVESQEHDDNEDGFSMFSLCSWPPMFLSGLCSLPNVQTIQCLTPLLMFAQFGFVFYTNDASIQKLSLSLVLVVLLIFTMTTFMYRQSIHDLLSPSCKIGSIYKIPKTSLFSRTVKLILLSVPDIAMDVVLGLILCKRTEIAYLMLLYVSSVLTIPIAINAARMIVTFLLTFCTYNEDELDITADDALMGFCSPYFENDDLYDDPPCLDETDSESQDDGMGNDLQTIYEAIPFFNDL